MATACRLRAPLAVLHMRARTLSRLGTFDAVLSANRFDFYLPVRSLSTSCVNFRKEDKIFIQKSQEKSRRDTLIASKEYFEENVRKNKESFKNAIELFTGRDHRRRGSVEFICAALKQMKPFGVHKDLEIYKALMNVMPKGEYVPKNLWQADFGHYPKQQDCLVDLLFQMELNRVVPDEETGQIIQSIFGIHSAPFKRYSRMCYWMPKFKNLSPWNLPLEVPNDPLELAKLAISQITSIDRLTQIKVYNTEEIPESLDKTWIVSGQSPDQKEMITLLPKEKALYVEGGFRVWLRESQVTYYILRGEALPIALRPKEAMEADIDDVSDYKMWIYGQISKGQDLIPVPNVHQQADGSIFACCATGTSTRDSLLSWIRFLQLENPDLENIPILFTLHSPLGPVVPLSEEELNLCCSLSQDL